MHKILLKMFALSVVVAAAAGCSQPVDIQASKQNFIEHQESFDRLSNVACTFANSNDIDFFRYPLDVQGEKAEAFKSEFDEIEHLLDTVNSELVVIRDFDDYHCELFVIINGTSFLGEGSSLKYVFQPVDLGNYEYTDDFFSEESRLYREANRARGEDVKFSIELENGWYLQYHLYP
ncbi:hypothetical protein [Pseudidiomarina donghaiensis]|uniref:Uncharacterized protein n=1 Tax=Pseudidiomarina donghaiensis TaxID=519452 RepID=A0A432XJV2_9GAMM|nr:hypothetical protein [Pseudidiomarina donghaiensis]RUO48991.1 hypothetical protein CWE24_00295 [Pseudidiomarina donghaiensis]